MAKAFEFADFVEEFKVPFVYVVQQEGYWDKVTGDYIESSEVPVAMEGIVLPLSEDDMRYSEAGTYTDKDKKLYTVQPLELGRKLIYKGDAYTIQSFRDYSEYADVFIYIARWREKAGDPA